MPDLPPYPQSGNFAPLEITAASGLSLYGQARLLDGRAVNVANGGFEAFNASNWANYAVSLNELIPGTGIYFGKSFPLQIPSATLMLPIYQQAGGSPASTDSVYQPPDSRYPLAYVLEIANFNSLVSVMPFRPAAGNNPVSLPARQTSLALAQEILNQLYAARLALASKPYATVNVDGQDITFTDPTKLEDSINFWERKVSLLSGRRRRVAAIRMDQMF